MIDPKAVKRLTQEETDELYKDAAKRLSRCKDSAGCDPDELFLFMFPQQWPYPGLGFEEQGDPAPTIAYTHVFIEYGGSNAVVYFDGRFAYLVRYTDTTLRPHFWPVGMPPVQGRVEVWGSKLEPERKS